MLTTKPIYFEFPVFRGSTEVRTTSEKSANKNKAELKLSDPTNDFSGASELSQSANYSTDEHHDEQPIDTITGEKTEKNQPVICTDDVQPIPSTTDYLDGMTHSDSPPGLLPRYSSWSLCCIGRASDYVSSKGILEFRITIENENVIFY